MADLVGYDRVVVSTLMPITIMWQDFAEKHEYTNERIPIYVHPEELNRLISSINLYISDVYQEIGVTEAQMMEVAEKLAPIMAEGSFPMPNSQNNHRKKEV